MSYNVNDPMSTGNDDTSDERGVSAPSAPDDASDSQRRDDGKRTPPAVSSTPGALAPGDIPRRLSEHDAESSHRASTIYASVPLESEDHDNQRFIRDDRQTIGPPTVHTDMRLQNLLDTSARAPRGAPAEQATKRPAEDSPQPAAKRLRYASHLRVGPLAPPPALPSLPVPAAPRLTLPSNNSSSQSTRAASGVANPPVRSVNYQANHPLLSGIPPSLIAQMGASLAAATAASASAMSLHQSLAQAPAAPTNQWGMPMRNLNAFQGGSGVLHGENPVANQERGAGPRERVPNFNAEQRPNQLDHAATAHALRLPPSGTFLNPQLPAPSTIAALSHAALPFSSNLSLSAPSSLSFPMFFPYDFTSFATSAQNEVPAGGGGSLPRQAAGGGSAAGQTNATQQPQHRYPLLMALGRAPITGRPAVPLYLNSDSDALSAYQCLVRKQIELFEAGTVDVESNAQGRNRPIVLGQVGIRCRHCAHLNPRERSRGATYYPAQLQGLYQACQNLSLTHLAAHCQLIPAEIRSELDQLRKRKSSAGGGKKYWADAAKVLGVYEDGDGLRFSPR